MVLFLFFVRIGRVERLISEFRGQKSHHVTFKILLAFDLHYKCTKKFLITKNKRKILVPQF